MQPCLLERPRESASKVGGTPRNWSPACPTRHYVPLQHVGDPLLLLQSTSPVLSFRFLSRPPCVRTTSGGNKTGRLTVRPVNCEIDSRKSRQFPYQSLNWGCQVKYRQITISYILSDVPLVTPSLPRKLFTEPMLTNR